MFKNERNLLRFAGRKDAKDLAPVYGDKNALRYYSELIVTVTVFINPMRNAWQKPSHSGTAAIHRNGLYAE